MARIRSLKPEFFTSEQVVSVSIEARYLFQGMWVFGDDDGYIAASPLQLKMKIFPGDACDVPALLGELVSVGLVVLVDTDQGPAYWVPSFRNHQKPKYPTPTKFTRDGVSLTEYSPRIPPELPQASGSASLREESRGEERRGEELRGVESRGEEKSPSSEVAHAPIRHDAEQLLDLLDTEIKRNGAKAPSRTKGNADAARLLLDRDGYTFDQVAFLIRWAQNDEFWRPNILSMKKLREKAETLRLQSQRKRGEGVTDNQARGLSLVQKYREQEAGHVQIANG